MKELEENRREIPRTRTEEKENIKNERREITGK